MQTETTLHESSVRRLARRRGYAVHKARCDLHFNNRGDYQLVDASRNQVVLGSDYDASLEDIVVYIKQWATK